MRKFIILLRHQIWLMLISPSTYFAAFLFLSLMAGIFVLSVREISVVAGKSSPVEYFLNLFWIPVLFMVPLLTMRSLSEELRRGTLSSLMTTAVSAWQIVLSKFMASYIFYCLLWLATLLYSYIVCWYIPHATSDDLFSVSQLFTGYGFIFLTGSMYVAVGIFASSLTRSTLVAGMLSFGMLFFLVTGAQISEKLLTQEGDSVSTMLSTLVDYLHTFKQLERYNNSLVDSRSFFFYISSTIMLLAFTSLITESKNR
ncbi:MAG: ABC transporter permease subunit [Opitutales bacterium]|nr:ABC transporter permease subunit [Opitutales bacterium]